MFSRLRGRTSSSAKTTSSECDIVLASVPTSPGQCGNPKTPTTSPSLSPSESPISPRSPNTTVSAVRGSGGRSLLGMFSNRGDKSKQKDALEKTSDSISAVPDGNVIIFDWDDTICPTWWIWNVLAFAVNHIELEEPIPSDPKMQVILKTRNDLSQPTSRFCADLKEHARAVEALLRNSRSLGRVSIVTMGSPPWFEHSAVFFPGLDLPALLQELDISVHFAVIPEVIPPGVDIKVAAKRASITECLIRHYGIGNVRWNVLSVGDQPEEREALKLCCRACPHRLRLKPICKSYTVEPEPMLKDMTASLHRLALLMKQFVTHDKDADWDFKMEVSEAK